MTDEQPPIRKVHEGEILPPERPRAGMPDLPPDTPLGIPLLARAKYEARTRAFRAYIEFRQAQHALIEVDTGLIVSMQNRLAAEERLASAFQRQQHLDKILLADEAKLLSELDDIFEAVADRDLERRIRKATLEADALEAEARLKKTKAAHTPKADADAGLSKAQRAAREVRRVRKERDELRDILVEAAGGESKLTDDDRAYLETLDLAMENRIREIFESL